jgi:hypothetical protein
MENADLLWEEGPENSKRTVVVRCAEAALLRKSARRLAQQAASASARGACWPRTCILG